FDVGFLLRRHRFGLPHLRNSRGNRASDNLLKLVYVECDFFSHYCVPFALCWRLNARTFSNATSWLLRRFLRFHRGRECRSAISAKRINSSVDVFGSSMRWNKSIRYLRLLMSFCFLSHLPSLTPFYFPVVSLGSALGRGLFQSLQEYV